MARAATELSHDLDILDPTTSESLAKSASVGDAGVDEVDDDDVEASSKAVSSDTIQLSHDADVLDFAMSENPSADPLAAGSAPDSGPAVQAPSDQKLQYNIPPITAQLSPSRYGGSYAGPGKVAIVSRTTSTRPLLPSNHR